MFTPKTIRITRVEIRAFTLIELLTVIAIIGILSAIIIPTVGRVRSTAKDAVGLSNLRQIALAASIYADDNRDRYPLSYTSGQSDFSSTLAAYIGAGSANYGNNKATNDIFRDPSATIPIGDLHYSAHPVLMPDHSINPSGFLRTRLRRPSETILVADGAQPLSGDAHASFYSVDGGGAFTPLAGNSSDNIPITPGPDTDTDSSGGHVRFRAAGGTGCKVVFADGHTRILKKDDFLRRYIRLEP